MADVQQRFQAVVTVLDNSAAGIRSINNRIAGIATPFAGIRASIGSVSTELAELSRGAGFTRLAAAAGGVAGAMGGLAAQAALIAAPLAGLGGGIGIAGLATLAQTTAAAAGDLEDMATKTGIAAAQLEPLIYAASEANVSAEAFASSMQKLNLAMVDAATGKNVELRQVFERLNIPLRQNNGQMRNLTEVLPRVAQAFMRNTNEQTRAKLATLLFGEAGQALIPMLARGAEGLRESNAVWEQYGYSLAEASEETKSADKQFEAFNLSAQGLRHAIGDALAPVFGPLAEEMAGFIRSNRELISLKAGEWARDIASSLREVNWGEVGRAVLTVGRAVKGAFGAIGGAISGLSNVLGPTNTTLLLLAGTIGRPLVSAVLELGKALLFVTPVLVGMTRALLANPIGAAITVIAGGALVIWRNWEPIKEWFSGLWRDISSSFDATLPRLREQFSRLGDDFKRIWEGMKEIVRSTVEFIMPLVQPLLDALAFIGRAAPSSPGIPAPAPGAPPWGGTNSPLPGGPLFLPQSYQPAGGGNPALLPVAAWRRGAAPRAGAGLGGTAEVIVRFLDAPPGMRAEAVPNGTAATNIILDVGYNLRGGRPRMA